MCYYILGPRCASQCAVRFCRSYEPWVSIRQRSGYSEGSGLSWRTKGCLARCPKQAGTGKRTESGCYV